MNSRNAPLSPVSSVSGTDWSYPPPSKDGPYSLSNKNRGQLISPPNSAGSFEAMNGGFQPGPRSAGGPSPPPSIGRSSTATNIYARSETGSRYTVDEAQQDAILGEHYVALKQFLSATSRDGKPTLPPNKARDKLQRLTSVQFLELSTDVYDELRRREVSARRPSNAPANGGPPAFLLPQENFHPKRNQARQKLSSLGPPRFRDLATDVFCELERRIPRFIAQEVPRLGSPVSSYPPRGANRRRPSEASSVRSGRGGLNGYGAVPPSPGPQNGDIGRPMPKQFQSNTIVPNKSTMLEEDDDLGTLGDGDAYPIDNMSDGRQSKRSVTERSETDRKLIEDYESQVRELRDKLDGMEDVIKRKEDEMANMINGERSRVDTASTEKRAWDDARDRLERELSEARNRNASLQQELDRVRDDHAREIRRLREQMEDLQQSSRAPKAAPGTDSSLQRENEELRRALEEQRQVTNDVRREANVILSEMRTLSQQSSSVWVKQSDLEKTIETLEGEVRDWRNRYARARTQLRDMRGDSTGLSLEQDVGRKVRERGFAQDNGLVRDVNVTKFQMAVDEFLRLARVDNPDKVIDSMKAVVASVRKITKDIDDSAHVDETLAQQVAKLKPRVSLTANNLITASRNFAGSAGISPVSLLDAAASHLVSAVVELLRSVKIRPTPSAELDDDVEDTETPVDSAGFVSSRSTTQSQSNNSSAVSTLDSLPRPPPFQGLGGKRGSADSSAYSPISSPRESYATKQPLSRLSTDVGNGKAGGASNGSERDGLGSFASMVRTKDLPSVPPARGGGDGDDVAPDTREQALQLKEFLDNQTSLLVQTIQDLVTRIRDNAAIDQLAPEIEAISGLVQHVVARTAEALGGGAAQLTERLESGRERLLEAGAQGRELVREGNDTRSREWRMWTATLPPISFEIARETKELAQRIDRLAGIEDADDFS